MTDIHISRAALEEILEYLSDATSERGGIIGANSSGQIVAFFADLQPSCSSVFEYYPNTESLSDVINGKWRDESIVFCGFVHSHPNNNLLSTEDLAYIRSVISAVECEELLCGVVDSRFPLRSIGLRWYLVKENCVLDVEAEII